MKRIMVTAGALLFLAGCSEGTIIYEGKERPIDEVQDILGDKLEVENPGMDLNVDIFETAD